MKLALFLTFFFTSNLLHALTQREFKQREDLLRDAIQRVANVCSTDSIRIATQSVVKDCDTAQRMALNRIFAAQFEQTLLQDSAFFYPFDDIPYLYKVASRDGLVRVFTWLVPLPDGNRYFGFLLTRKSKTDVTATLTTLHDSRKETQLVENKELNANEWFGALYTALTVHSAPYTNKPVYTLIGISPTGGSSPSNKKVVDILNVKPNGECTFGAPIFVRKNKVTHRMIFEYSAQAVMELRYQESSGMIIFSALEPMYRQLRGRYEHYIPSESYDGVRFEQGQWMLRENVKPPSNVQVKPRGKIDKKTGVRR
jgi:hypothetical protein